MQGFKVVETDNFGRDFPDEKWATPYIYWRKEYAQKVADVLNDIFCPTGDDLRYWKVVDSNYILQPGFEP